MLRARGRATIAGQGSRESARRGTVSRHAQGCRAERRSVNESARLRDPPTSASFHRCSSFLSCPGRPTHRSPHCSTLESAVKVAGEALIQGGCGDPSLPFTPRPKTGATPHRLSRSDPDCPQSAPVVGNASAATSTMAKPTTGLKRARRAVAPNTVRVRSASGSVWRGMYALQCATRLEVAHTEHSRQQTQRTGSQNTAQERYPLGQGTPTIGERGAHAPLIHDFPVCARAAEAVGRVAGVLVRPRAYEQRTSPSEAARDACSQRLASPATPSKLRTPQTTQTPRQQSRADPCLTWIVGPGAVKCKPQLDRSLNDESAVFAGRAMHLIPTVLLFGLVIGR